MMAQTVLGGYKSYTFTEDHDPVLDQIDRLRELNGFPTNKKIAERSGLALGTLSNWSSRKTRRPQFASVVAAVRAIGGNIVVIYKGKRIYGRSKNGG